MKKQCLFCNKEYTKPYKYSKKQWDDSRFCSHRCVRKANPLSQEVRIRIRNKIAGRSLSAEHKKHISESHAKRVLEPCFDGKYLRLSRTGQRLHRKVMEDFLGRKLLPWEHIHHIDGDTFNNSIDNLMVVSPQEHGRIHRPTGCKNGGLTFT